MKIEAQRNQALDRNLTVENPLGQVVGVLTMAAEQRSGDDMSVSMPCYIPCQQVKLIQHQQQQPPHQTALLSPVCSRYSVATVQGGGAGTPVMSTVPCLQLPAGFVVNAGSSGTQVISGNPQTIHHGIDGNRDHYIVDYDPKSILLEGVDMHGIKMSPTKTRKRKSEDRVCSNCNTRNTPFWRKDKHTGKPLCNACGLYYSKNDAPRPMSLWRNVGTPGDSQS